MTPPPPQPPPRTGLLAAVAVGFLALLAYRGYSPTHFTRPTETVAPKVPAVDLNAASRVELLQVPGMGPALADAILSHRDAGRRFERVEDLVEVRGIGPKTLDKLRPFVRTDSTVVRGAMPEESVEKLERKPAAPPDRPAGKLQPGDSPLDINAASESDLLRLPAVGPTLAARIVATRKEKPFASVEELRRVSGIGAKTLDKLRPFVVVR